MTTSIVEVPLVAPDTLAPLQGGDGATPFALSLPAGAACPSDSASGGARVNTFMVPTSVDIATVSFNAFGPRQGVPLFADGHPVVNANTALHTGLIVGLPRFDLSVVAGGKVSVGDYRVGVACTSAGVVRAAWTSSITVTANPASERSLTWIATRPSAVPSATAGAAVVTDTPTSTTAVAATSSVVATTSGVADSVASMVVQPVVADVASVAMPMSTGAASGDAAGFGAVAALVAVALGIALLLVWRVVARRRAV